MEVKRNLEQFAKQFLFEPKIENLENFRRKERFIVLGMGGSNLTAGLLKIFKPDLKIIIHKDYGLPRVSDEELKESLIIANSFSGNTEEIIDGFLEALKKGYSLTAVSKNGKLLRLAKEKKVPYIKLPDLKIQPRLSLGLSFKAFLKIMAEEEDLKELTSFSKNFFPSDFEKTALFLAEELKGFIPVVYSSLKNAPLAYTWKIQFNETAKIPAFYNVFPELNHNEIAGVLSSPSLSKLFFFIFLTDSLDNPQIIKRMKLTRELYQKKGLKVKEIVLDNTKGVFYKIFSSFILVGWTTFYLAQKLNKEAGRVEVIEKFKKQLSSFS